MTDDEILRSPAQARNLYGVAVRLHKAGKRSAESVSQTFADLQAANLAARIDRCLPVLTDTHKRMLIKKLES